MFSSEKQESDLRYLESLLECGVASLTPKTLTPNFEKLIFVKDIPEDLWQSVVAERMVSPTSRWYVVDTSCGGFQGLEESRLVYNLEEIGYPDLAVARERLERAAALPYGIQITPSVGQSAILPNRKAGQKI